MSEVRLPCQQITPRKGFADLRNFSRGRTSMEEHDISSLWSYHLRNFRPHRGSHILFPHLAARDPLS